MNTLHTVETQDKTVARQPETPTEPWTQSETVEAVSVWETARRRSQHHRHLAAQARTQGRRRQLRRWWGRGR